MEIQHRTIDFTSDMDYVLECHCKINYACDCPWARKIPYQQYREEWFSMKNQINGFCEYLKKTANDDRTIAEIIEDDSGRIIGYLWVPFHSDEESRFDFAEIQDLYIEEVFRQQGLAEALIEYAECKAREHGAKVMRSGTGCENIPSIRLYQKLGYYQYRHEFEKEL